MTMNYRIIIAGGALSPSERTKINTIIAQTFDEINRIYNKWNPESELSKLNQAQSLQKIALSHELTHFLFKTDKLVKLSNGRFDPTIEAVQKIWKNNLNQGKIPSEEEIKKASKAVGWNKIHFEDGIFWKEHEALELDLGGIAKGYAIDLILERLNNQGNPSVYVEWGGEIRTSGNHPSGRPWRIFISNLGNTDPDMALATLDMNNNAVATSGDYLQNWTLNEKTYFHIINPKTCHLLTSDNQSICSVTIMTNDCMTADALATTAMLFPSVETSEQWLEKVKTDIPNLRYWISTRSL